jgi:D-alanine-D-alanine ligase
LKIVNSKLKTAVLAGGIGQERDISLQSGDCVAKALKQIGLNAVIADIAPDNLDILENGSIDVFFIALHGKFGEDGQLQQILEDRGLCYTGSGPKASRLAFDKLSAKQRFIEAGVTTPKVIPFDVNTEAKQLEQLCDKFVVKPIRQGSTIGVTIVDNPKSALAEARKCSAQYGNCMIEEFIPGRDVTVGILCNQVLPIIELRTQTCFYDYQAKYVDDRTQFLFDTIDDPAVTAKIESAAIDCFNALGLRHFARVDFRLSNDKIPYALEQRL